MNGSAGFATAQSPSNPSAAISSAISPPIEIQTSQHENTAPLPE
ncbi:hypothetical protein QGP82_08210 [Leptothoe sp. LEGE 181152]|nr:hypothetical protein [Leptothoe sp. LEGE 181152]